MPVSIAVARPGRNGQPSVRVFLSRSGTALESRPSFLGDAARPSLGCVGSSLQLDEDEAAAKKRATDPASAPSKRE